MLKVENLTKHFGGVKAVARCSLEIKPGLITALIGPNGAGKSTVFNIISGITKADSGRVIFQDKDITNKSPEYISNLGMARLFQQARLFNNLTVKDNLLLAQDNEDTKFWKNLFGKNPITKDKEKRVKEALGMVAMVEFAEALGRDLSYGQKRLAELARTLINPHSFLMLDEPVAGVNPKLRKTIADILLKLKQAKETILLIEHDMNFTFSVADWVIVLAQGEVLTQGKPQDIKNNPKVLEAYLGD